MRHRLNIILAIMSCCFLLLSQSCNQNAGFDEGSDTHSKPHSGGNVPHAGDSDKTLPVDQAPFPVIPPGPGPALLPPPPLDEGGGGGSQGAVKNARTGNPDENPPQGPNGICPNGIQEVLPDNPRCIYDIYGATTDGPDGESHLIGFDLSQDGIGYDLGVIPTIHRVSALDFGADGTLFAVGENDLDQSVFATIDCQSPHEVVIIGRTFIENLSGGSEVITDIDFDSNGRLFAYVRISMGPDEVGLINPASGQYQTLGATGLEDEGNGLGSTPFPTDMLYQAGDDDINIINKLTGVATPGMNIGFIPPVADNDPRINALDNDPFTNLMYASITDAGTENFLTLINVNSGVITFLAEIPQEAPEGLDAIAVNRRFEECDPLASEPALPPGTACTEDCELIEDNCFDDIDNDQDTLTDCEDPDCFGDECNDGNGCTTNDTCVFMQGNVACVGTPVDCEEIIGNECSMDMCESISSEPGEDNFKCNSMLRVPVGEETIFGLCTPFGNCVDDDVPDDERNEDGSCDPEDVIDVCIVGRCVIELDPENGPPDFLCEGGEKEFIPIEDGGCLDENPCTADDCEEAQDGECDYDALQNVFCEEDGNRCTIEICVVDIGLNSVCTFIEDAVEGTACNDGNQCTVFDECDDDGDCSGVPANTETPCDDFNDCTVNNFCNENPAGFCDDGDDVANSCLLDADCANGRPCINEIPGICSAGSSNPGAACLIDLNCPGGICVGEIAGQCGCNIDGTEAGTNCVLGVCLDGDCLTGEPALVDEVCDLVDDVCTTEECTLDGCKITLMDGPMICPITLASLSMEFDVLLSGLGLEDLICDFGILLCVDGEQDSECELTEDLFEPCSEASLEASCTINDLPASISAIAAAAICTQLPLELEPTR